MRYARNNVGIVEALVEAGADINAPRTDREPEGAIDEAVKANSIDTVRWMVRQGAQLNHTVDGERRSLPSLPL